MIFDSFGGRAQANMEVALDRICNGRPDGQSHELRAFIGESLIECARKGHTTLGALTQAGEAALARWSKTTGRPAGECHDE
jgi:hypothetical protein